ncbi:chaperonin 10-like protein [Chaetomidium leptoderma]|uniref:Chaperonin 10-like protein n=1 Tax=Chaetomidium leptoderma TaxID=669021 RepID=A0AAN6ZZI9_9PEZI|nr:chaperonin 10-like protein [Chaetomidium leptoderma]
MSDTSFLRRVWLRQPLTDSKVDGLQPVIHEQSQDQPPAIPETQTVLLLHEARQPYRLTDSYPVPELRDDREILVRTQAIGLTPVDWKAPDFNFAIPVLPHISGRESAGEVVLNSSRASRFKVGDRVLAISTDYRDLRKAAYQQYAIAFDYNTVRLPSTLSPEEGSTLGVAFVAAALALGVCMGLDFSSVLDGPDLYTLLRELPPDSLAADIRNECLDGLRAHDRAQPGDWLAIWGGSSTSANLTLQLARLAGLRTIAVADKAKHGLRLSAPDRAARPDLLVDSHDPSRAVAIIRANMKQQQQQQQQQHEGGGEKRRRTPLRFGIDTRGRESAGWLMQALLLLGPEEGETTTTTTTAQPPPSPPATPHYDYSNSESGTDGHQQHHQLSAHLVGLTGLPKQQPEDVVFHTVPIKLFHEVPAVGEALVEWLERLLEKGLVTPPEIIGVQHGLGSVNRGLDRMRKGEISGGKLVVRVG